MNAIDAKFADLKRRGRKAFMPFLTAGDPDIATTPALANALVESGALLEVGFPYSDPIADGPVIQASYTRTLAKGVKLADVFAAARRVADESPKAPLVAMTSYSLVHRRGPAKFVEQAAASGFAGIIVPDLPHEEAAQLGRTCRERNLALVQMVTPTTSRQRAAAIVAGASGFVYCVSIAGITGERSELPPELIDQLRWLRTQTALPLCVGFGVSRPEHVRLLREHVDGVIVGSAFVRQFEAGGDIASRLTPLCRALAGALNEAVPYAARRRDDNMPDTPPPTPSHAPTVGLTPGSLQRGTDAGMVGARLGDYEILGELGRGGMGIVYKARQLHANRVVALKMILSAQPDEESRARFHREAEAAAQLAHPQVVQIHEVGTWRSPEGDELPYFSMEYCSGGNLADYLAGTPLAPARAAALLEVLARAVHAAHAKRLIHRDLKPANVLLAPDERGDGSAVLLEKEAAEVVPLLEALAQARHALARRRGEDPQAEDARKSSGRHPPPKAAQRYVPKITDFGLARRTDDTLLTATGAIVGTPSYVAPEQARGQKEIGPACDVWALGALLYECLTGRPPFLAASPFETLMQVMEKEPAPPQQLNAQVPADLQAVCLRCLEKRPHRRYGSAEELADDLRRFRDGRPTRARPRGLLGRGNLWCQHPQRIPDAGRVTVFVALVLASWVGLCGVGHALSTAESPGVPSLLGGTGGLALALLLAATGTLKRRPLALWAGLALSSLGLLALLTCLAGYPVLAVVGEGGAYADVRVRIPLFALLSVLLGVVVVAHVVAVAAHLADRTPTEQAGAGSSDETA